jgi:beta-xylosidase
VLTYRKPGVGAVYKSEIPQTSDEFDQPKLGLQWQWHANFREEWSSLTARPGWMRLQSQLVEGGDFANASNLLMQKLPAPAFTVDTKLETSHNVGERAGLIIMGNKHAALLLRQAADGVRIVYQINNQDQIVEPWSGGAVHLRVAMQTGGLCTFSYSPDGRSFHAVAPAFQAVEGKWIGAKIGIFSIASEPTTMPGHADFDYFRFSPPK